MDPNTSAKFLVAGAGGRLGATGNHVVRQLLARKLPVRALVFRADQRSEQLAALGAEVVVGDLHDISAVRRAMRDVTRAYFVYPLAEGLIEAITIFAAAAKEARVESIVNMSQVTARADFPSLAARRYWLGEHILDWTGIGVTHLQPTLFLENLLVFAGLLFGLRLFDVEAVGRAFAAFGVFCLLSGVVYLINDIADRHTDRQHPLKALRMHA